VYDIADLAFMDSLGDDGASETAEMPVSSALVSVAGIDIKFVLLFRIVNTRYKSASSINANGNNANS